VAEGLPFTQAFEREAGETPDAAAAHAWRTYRRWTTWLPTLASTSATWTLILILAFVAFAVRLRQRIARRRQWSEEDQWPVDE
jgi:hypothetical protein